MPCLTEPMRLLVRRSWQWLWFDDFALSQAERDNVVFHSFIIFLGACSKHASSLDLWSKCKQFRHGLVAITVITTTVTNTLWHQPWCQVPSIDWSKAPVVQSNEEVESLNPAGAAGLFFFLSQSLCVFLSCVSLNTSLKNVTLHICYKIWVQLGANQV